MCMYVCMRAAGHSNYTRRWEERCVLLPPLSLSLSVHVKRPSLGPSIASPFFSRRCGVRKDGRRDRTILESPRGSMIHVTDELIPRSTAATAPAPLN